MDDQSPATKFINYLEREKRMRNILFPPIENQVQLPSSSTTTNSIDTILEKLKRKVETTKSIAAMEEEIIKRKRQEKEEAKLQRYRRKLDKIEADAKEATRREKQAKIEADVEEETEWIRNYYIVSDLPEDQRRSDVFWGLVRMGPNKLNMFDGKEHKFEYADAIVRIRTTALIKSCLKYNEYLARYGGDRFKAQDAYTKWRNEPFRHFEAALLVESRSNI